MSSEKLYSVSQVANMLGVSSQTVRRLIKDKVFPNAFKPAHAVNSHWRIPERDVQAYFQSIGKTK